MNFEKADESHWPMKEKINNRELEKEQIDKNILEINLKIEAICKEWEIKFQNCLNGINKIIPEDKIWQMISNEFEKKILDYDYKLKKEFFLFDDIELSTFLNMSNETNKKISQYLSIENLIRLKKITKN